MRFCIYCLLCLISSAARSQEVWTECKLKIPVIEDFQVQPEVQARFRHDPSMQAYAYLYRIGVKYKINKTWRVGGTFRLTHEHQPDEITVAEIPDRKRYTLDSYANFPLRNDRSVIENRLRLQVSQSRKMNYNHYARYRLGIQYRLSKNIYTTVSDEIYFEIPEMELPLNKTSVDIEFLVNDGIGLELFYTIETDPQGIRPRFTYILGCKVEISPMQLFSPGWNLRSREPEIL